MADINAQDVVDMFNTYIKDQMNRNIRWGSDNYPPEYDGRIDDGGEDPNDIYNNMFTGPTSGVTASPNASDLSGEISQSNLRSLMVNFAGYYTVLRRVKVDIRYRFNESVGGSSGDPTGQYGNFGGE